MRLLSKDRYISIIQRALNYVDPRLVDHGKRVAYLAYRLLAPLNKYGAAELRDILILAALHDIGAYKTEEIDNMVAFETVDVWEHSIYGGIFLRYFSPLRELASVITFHHANCNELVLLENPEHRFLAQVLSMCDRADVFLLCGGNNNDFVRHINKTCDTVFFSEVADLFTASGVNIDTVFGNMDADKGFNDVFYNTERLDVNSFIEMVIYSIDFRSNHTVKHTVATVCVAETLARLYGFNENEIEKVRTGALLHDIGKIGISVGILENPGKLNAEDMAIMRTHVELSEAILTGNASEEIINIAVNHHEKLDGSGYPKKLTAENIGMGDRIVAIADIFSALYGSRSYKTAFSKERIIQIFGDMNELELLDKRIVELAINHYDAIVEAVEREALPVTLAYDAINEEYRRTREHIARKISV